MGIEIEKKFTVKKLPDDLEKYPMRVIEQGYLNVTPAIRVRRQDNKYYMTYKRRKAADDNGSSEGIGQIEYNLPLDEDSYTHLVAKADGNVIRKKRYIIPINEDAFDEAFLDKNIDIKDSLEKGSIKIELDVFEAPFEGRILAEVEFPSEEAAAAYKPAGWFDSDVTGDYRYSNSQMSMEKI